MRISIRSPGPASFIPTRERHNLPRVEKSMGYLPVDRAMRMVLISIRVIRKKERLFFDIVLFIQHLISVKWIGVK